MKLVKILVTLCILCLLLTSLACGKKGPPTALRNEEVRLKNGAILEFGSRLAVIGCSLLVIGKG